MVDYSMCCQTVTVYRKTDAGIVRQEIPNCFLQWEDRLVTVKVKVKYTETDPETGEETENETEKEVTQQEREFLLIQPGQEQLVFLGDKIYEGVGPEVTARGWEKFVPDGVVTYTKVYRWQGQFCHTEAGKA